MAKPKLSQADSIFSLLEKRNELIWSTLCANWEMLLGAVLWIRPLIQNARDSSAPGIAVMKLRAGLSGGAANAVCVLSFKIDNF